MENIRRLYTNVLFHRLDRAFLKPPNIDLSSVPKIIGGHASVGYRCASTICHVSLSMVCLWHKRICVSSNPFASIRCCCVVVIDVSCTHLSRHMCRFFSGSMFNYPLLAEYKWFWRLDSGMDLSIFLFPEHAMSTHQSLSCTARCRLCNSSLGFPICNSFVQILSYWVQSRRTHLPACAMESTSTVTWELAGKTTTSRLVGSLGTYIWNFRDAPIQKIDNFARVDQTFIMSLPTLRQGSRSGADYFDLQACGQRQRST